VQIPETQPTSEFLVTPRPEKRSTDRVISAPRDPDVDDQQRVVAAARQGDDAAWESLYLSLYPRLRAFFARRLGIEHADDAVSETITRAVASIDRFQWGEAGFDGWVFGIARHVSADHHRAVDRGRRYRHIGRLFSGGKTDGTAPVDQDVVIGDDQALIRRLFTRLSPDEREVLELRVIAGLSSEQVGEALGRQPGAIRTAQSRALAYLRQLMEEHDA
jgi:RNA polymerase sigma-70 factor, ECF subfamily